MNIICELYVETKRVAKHLKDHATRIVNPIDISINIKQRQKAILGRMAHEVATLPMHSFSFRYTSVTSRVIYPILDWLSYP